MDVVAGAEGVSGEVVPGAVQPQVSTRKTTRQEQRIRMIFINGMSPAERIYLMTPRTPFLLL
jgi:Na+-transporting methylmalonyl-CoA/oxaloacetate decarboxylase beta subunit